MHVILSPYTYIHKCIGLRSSWPPERFPPCENERPGNVPREHHSTYHHTHQCTRTHISSRRRRVACIHCPRDMYRSVGRLSHSCGTSLFSTLHPRSTPPGVRGCHKVRTHGRSRSSASAHTASDAPHLNPVSAAPAPNIYF